MKKTLLAVAVLLSSFHTAAAEPFRGADYSGVYDCTGDDSHEGKYTATVTMKLDRTQSTGQYGAYSFKLEVPGYGTYLGQAVSLKKTLAIHFALTDPTTKDYGTGIATVATQKGKTTFRKFYYEPEFKGGNHGFEDCTKR